MATTNPSHEKWVPQSSRQQQVGTLCFYAEKFGFSSKKLQATEESNALRHEKKSISKNNANVSLLICVDINAIEEHGSQGEKGNTMCHIFILIREEEENEFLGGNKAFTKLFKIILYKMGI